MSSIEAQVKSIVAEQLGVKEDEVTNQASFVDDLGADSLDTVELVMALEEESGRGRREDQDRAAGNRLHHPARHGDLSSGPGPASAGPVPSDPASGSNPQGST